MVQKRGSGVLCTFSDRFGLSEGAHICISMIMKVNFGRAGGNHLMEFRGAVHNFPAQFDGTQPGRLTYTKWYPENTQKRVEIITQLTSTQTWALAICVCDVVKWSEVN